MMVLLSVVSMVTAAMAVCPTDRDTYHRLRTNCSATGLSHIPLGLEPTTQVLVLSNNQFSSLSWSSFTQFPEIYEVDLTSNQVPEITPSSAPSLPTLSVLRLCSNRLTSLQDSAFSTCPALIELRLQHNHISSLSSHCFSGLRLLQILDLTSNRIAVLPELLLRPLVALEFLYLENNQIQVVPADWFIIKEEVPYLFLSANPWACSCRLSYLHMYLSEYEDNVYVRDGTTHFGDVKSVVCASPPSMVGLPLLDLSDSDLCPPTPPVPGETDSVFSLSPTLSTPTTVTTPHQRSVTVRPRPVWTSLAPPSAPPPLTTAEISTLAPPSAPPPPLTTAYISTMAPPTRSAPPPPLTTAYISTMAPPTRSAPPPPLTTAEISTLAPPSAPPPPLTTADISTMAPPTRSAPPPPPLTTADISALAPPTGSAPPPPPYRCLTLKPLPLPPPAWPGPPPPRRAPKAGGGVRAASFCVWMLIGCLMLCVAALAAILASSLRLVQMLRMMKVMKAKGYPPLAPPPTALYRSVLFVQREGAEPGYYSLTLRAGP